MAERGDGRWTRLELPGPEVADGLDYRPSAELAHAEACTRSALLNDGSRECRPIVVPLKVVAGHRCGERPGSHPPPRLVAVLEPSDHVGLRAQERGPGLDLGQDLDIAQRAVDSDLLFISDQPGGTLYAHDGR